MANPSYYQTGPSVWSQVRHQEHLFHLYAHQQHGSNDYTIVQPKAGLPNFFGCTNVVDWDIRDAPDTKATVVARLQGVGIAARKSSESWYSSFNVVFTDERFNGSTLSVQGSLGPATIGDEGDWTVVGGTGEFVYAQGICTYKRIQIISGGTITELRIRVVCLTFPKPDPVQKVGPWGGNGGNIYEIPDSELPQRLLSITIYANNNFIQTIAFSYIDQAGQTRTVGPWGGDAGRSQQPPIQLGPYETVREIHGATGDYYGSSAVATLTIVTNVKTYGPYGRQSGANTRFEYVATTNNHSIVGFYGRVGDYVDQIGAYEGPN